MKTLSKILILAFAAGSTLLDAQEPAQPVPVTENIVEEPEQVADPEMAENGACEPHAPEPEVEVPEPTAASDDASEKEESSEHDDQTDVQAPVGTDNNDVVSGEGGFSFEGSFLQDFWFSPFMAIVRCGLLVLWVALGCATAAIFQPAIAKTQNELRLAPGRCAALGFLWLISFWILLLFGAVMALVLIGLPFILVVLVFDLALRVFGLTVTFAVIGEWVARRLNRPGVSIYTAVFLGACVLGLLRLIPVAGSFIWFAAALFGVGATMATRFGTSMNPPALGYPTASVPMAPMTA